MRDRMISSLLALAIVNTATSSIEAFAQSSDAPSPVTFTADQDHQNMMDQLGIKALRPGPSGDEKAPNHANYDESKANPFPGSTRSSRSNNGDR